MQAFWHFMAFNGILWHFGIFAKKSNKKSNPIFPIFRLFPTFRLSDSTALLWKHTFLFALLPGVPIIATQVPEEYKKPFLHINNTARRTFSGMVMAMDEAVRTCFANNRICTSNIVQFFLVHLILDLMLSFYNSIFVFSQNIIKP